MPPITTLQKQVTMINREHIIVSGETPVDNANSKIPKIRVEISVSFPPNTPTSQVIDLITEVNHDAILKVLKGAEG